MQRKTTRDKQGKPVLSNLRLPEAHYAHGDTAEVTADGAVVTIRPAVCPPPAGPPVGRTAEGSRMKIDVTIRVEVSRGQNNREHHMVRAKRVKAEREATAAAMPRSPVLNDDEGARVTLLRPYARTPLDSDNLSGAFKGVRDETASFLGVDDKSPRLHFRYVQCKIIKALGLYVRCRIEIMPASDVDPMLTAVRVLRAALIDRDNDGDLERALATADALATFDPTEMYR